MRSRKWEEVSRELARRREKEKESVPQGRQEDKESKRRPKKSAEELFQSAMHDVQPLSTKKSGRQIIPDKDTVKPSPGAPDTEKKYRQYLQDLVQGRVEFDLEHTKEYLQGSIKGLDRRIMQDLKAGKYSPQAHLDLHGLTAEEAWKLLLEFVREHFLAGKRCLLLIPGRGKNSPFGKSVLRDQIQVWLTRAPLKRVILGFSTAQPRHGGAGALYILLRKYKKKHGKIQWDKFAHSPPEI